MYVYIHHACIYRRYMLQSQKNIKHWNTHRIKTLIPCSRSKEGWIRNEFCFQCWYTLLLQWCERGELQFAHRIERDTRLNNFTGAWLQLQTVLGNIGSALASKVFGATFVFDILYHSWLQHFVLYMYKENGRERFLDVQKCSFFFSNFYFIVHMSCNMPLPVLQMRQQHTY